MCYYPGDKERNAGDIERGQNIIGVSTPLNDRNSLNDRNDRNLFNDQNDGNTIFSIKIQKTKTIIIC